MPFIILAYGVYVSFNYMGVQRDATELFVYVRDLHNDFPMSRASFMAAEFLFSIFVLFFSLIAKRKQKGRMF